MGIIGPKTKKTKTRTVAMVDLKTKTKTVARVGPKKIFVLTTNY